VRAAGRVAVTRRQRPIRRSPYELSPVPESLVIEWERFSSFSDACKRFPTESCLYTLARPTDRTALYVGKASGLRRRYAAAFGALNALMSESAVLFFVAPVDGTQLEFAEHTIIFWDCPVHNTRGVHTRPTPDIPILHRFNGVGSWWGGGLTVERGTTYEGPMFCGPGTMRDRHTGELK
jgi:hypothetical protein